MDQKRRQALSFRAFAIGRRGVQDFLPRVHLRPPFQVQFFRAVHALADVDRIYFFGRSLAGCR